MQAFTIVDGIVLVIIVLSAILAWARGLVRETLSIAGWVVAALAGFAFAPVVAPLLRELPVLRDLIGSNCELAILAGEADLTAEVLVRAVKTRWNTVTMVLERALTLKDVLLELCDKHQFNGPKSARLRRFILSDEEWTVLQQLYLLLDVHVLSFMGCNR